MKRVYASGVDEQFLLARLHGMWAGAAQGDRLKALAHSTTPEILRENLRKYRLDAESRETFYQSLLDRKQGLLRFMQRLAPDSISVVCKALLCEPWYENLKTALHALVAPRERRGELRSVMLITESIPTLDLDTPIESWPLPPGLTHQDLEKARALLHNDGDYLGTDTCLDRIFFRLLRDRAKKSPHAFREAFLPLLEQRIDILNICSLLRNLRTYHLPQERMEELWLEGGESLTPAHLSFLNAKQDFGAAVAALPEHYRHYFTEGGSTEFWEGRLWNGLFVAAKRYFMDFTHPLYSLGAFPTLLHFETLNLGRIFEGVHFAIPAEQMMTMLTGA